MSDPTFDDRKLSFGAAASSYADHRPGYPREAVAWVLEGARRPVRDVADVGAGAGALTRTLAGMAESVTAYEPDAAMLDELQARVPGVRAVVSRAEQLPAADASLDAVLVAQAWHWFEHAAAAAEFGRVLRPGGVIGLLWNVRDTRVPWMAGLQQIIGGEDSMRMVAESSQDLSERAGTEEIREFLPAVERASFAHTVPLTPEQLLGLVSTYSYVRLSPRADQLYAEVRELLATHPDTAGRDVIEMPYVTATYRSPAP
ncbi:MAG: class I SAM-dependent methyltransferase [Candidatus Nanopelagicales bacterium]